MGLLDDFIRSTIGEGSSPSQGRSPIVMELLALGTGPNKPIAPSQLHDALGAETVEDLSRQTGMPRDDLLSELSRLLPGVVDKLTPNGQLPAEQDLLPGPR
jgi:hypothetical protein